MNDPELTRVTWQLLAVLAGEVLFVAVVLWLLLKCDLSAIWRRTICRAAVICSLLIVGFEFSGGGRSAAVWIDFLKLFVGFQKHAELGITTSRFEELLVRRL